MPKKTKAEQKKITLEEDKNRTVESSEERSYYYDDSHGYENYDPQKEDEDRTAD